ncbi:MAG TPA: hypothetical protein VE621_16250 [Bryobacteraceae bacterium]|nr:hypothetical protein [Bryobacteraceae bacterium]
MHLKSLITPVLAGVFAFITASSSASAQVTLYGSLSNFDLVNDTGETTHGFEIDFEGASGIYSYYNWNRYGAPTVTPLPSGSGMRIRWASAYDAATGRWVTGTPAAVNPTQMTGHQCIVGTAGYDTAGCEHFGISVLGNATRKTYRWLFADPNNPGQLVPASSLVQMVTPVWNVVPPNAPGEAPAVVAVVEPPVPPPPAKRYGVAQWMKTYKTEIARQVNLEELVADNPVVPEDESHVETAWDLLQSDIQDAGGRRRQKRGSLSGGSHAVVRRFELYKFTGTYDPVTNQAICLDGTCTNPDPSEIGAFIGAENGAANLNAPDYYPVTVSVTGDGQVSDSTSQIRCPGTCTMSVKAGSAVTLTAKGAKGVFSGWGGACSGTSGSCTINVNSDAPVTATFKMPYRLVLKTNGSGAVSSNPSGSSFLEGTVVTVTATPGAGATWKGWTGGGCSGLSLSCTVTISADTTLTANFR